MPEDHMYRWPDYYDWTSEGLDGDLSYYADLAMKVGGPVLELGCGTGRCTLGIARHGLDVVGIDRESIMLQQAARKAEAMGLAHSCRWIQGDMSQFELEEQYPLVVIPYRSFLHLMTPREQLDTLSCIHRHLKDDGILAFNIFVPHVRHMTEEDGKYLYRGSFPIPGTGSRVEVYDGLQFDHFNQHAFVIRYYERFDSQGRTEERLRTRFSLRYIYPAEVDLLLRSSGFEVCNRYGGFQREPFGPDSDELIIEARKAGSV